MATVSSVTPARGRARPPGAATVDSHAHVWSLDPNAYPWQPTFGYVPTAPATPDALLASMDACGVAHAILVQPSVYDSDHRFLLKTVREHADRFLPIGLVDPADPAAIEDAGSLVEAGCVGLRVNLSSDSRRAARQAHAPAWAALSNVGVPICLRAAPAHHELVLEILRRHERTRFIVDHLGLPEPAAPAAAVRRLGELAGLEHCWLKIAGLAQLSTCAPPHRDVWPLVRAAIRLFGVSRLIWGSDFPNADYRASVHLIGCMPFMTGAERHQLMAETPSELWGLPR